MCQLGDASAGSEVLWVSNAVTGSDWESCMVWSRRDAPPFLLEVFTCDPVQVEDVHTHMQHVKFNKWARKSLEKVALDTSKVSTVLSAIVKIVDVIIINQGGLN